MSTVCPGCGAPIQLDPLGRCVYCGHVSAPGTSPAVPASVAGVTSREALADSIVRAVPDKKIEAIKELRAKTGLGLKEAKDLVDAAELRAKVR